MKNDFKDERSLAGDNRRFPKFSIFGKYTLKEFCFMPYEGGVVCFELTFGQII